jgi:hypothetical protein
MRINFVTIKRQTLRTELEKRSGFFCGHFIGRFGCCSANRDQRGNVIGGVKRLPVDGIRFIFLLFDE